MIFPFPTPQFKAVHRTAKRNTSTTAGFTNSGFWFCFKEQKGKGRKKKNETEEEKPWGKNGFSFRVSGGSDCGSHGASDLLGRKAFLQPEGGGRATSRGPPVDAPQPQQVEQDGEQDHQEAAREQVVIVHKGEAPPVRVAGPKGLLLDVSARREENRPKK